jgi:glucose-1-phosphate adenylyltransferase
MNSLSKDLITMIMAGGRGERLFPLTRSVAKPAVAFGGTYKIIDFTLSNCFNSGIHRIYLLTQYSNATMSRHLRRTWDLIFRSDLDEFLEELPPQHHSIEDWYHGTADSIYQNISVLQKHRPARVLILSGDHVYKMDYTSMLQAHAVTGAELTVAGVESDRYQARNFGVMEIDDKNRLLHFFEKPETPPSIPSNPEKSLVSMGIYVFDTVKLVKELIRDGKNRRSSHDFGKDVIPAMIERGARIYVYSFRNERTGIPMYWRDIGTLDSYFECSFDLLADEPGINLYDRHWPIRVCANQYPPARIVDSTVDFTLKGTAEHSIISHGCTVSGAKVDRSILSPNVQVHAGASVLECILHEGVVIGHRAAIRNTIVCPGVCIPDGARVGYDRDSDRRRFTVTDRGVVVIPEEYTW